MNLRLVTLVAASFALSFSGFAAETAAPAPVAATVSESRDITPARYPNADTVVLDRVSRIVVDAEGGYVRTSTTRTKALTEKGRRDLQSYSTGFSLSYGSTKATGLRIFKADGTVVTLDAAKQSAVQQDPSSMEANIYDPNDRKLVVAIPGVEIGDSVEITIEETAKKSPMPGCFSDITTFEDEQPVLHTRYTVVTPKSLPLVSIAIEGGDDKGITHTKTEKGDTIEYTWETGETPQIIPEPEMPDAYLCVRRLLVSTVPDWATISKWYWSVSKPHYTITPDIQKEADELLKGITGREERIRAIYRFVSQQIRYMGVISETEAPGFEPHDVNLTFGKRYGVCRDKAALLAVMLRAAGFEAYPVLINAGSKVDPSAPGLRFNHAITAIKEADGSYRLLDSTNESTKDIFPAYLHNCSYLVANPDGDTLHVSPLPDAAGQMLDAETKLTVAKDGSVSGETVLNFGGINDTIYRGHFAQSKPDDIRRFVQTAAASAIPGVRIDSVKIEPENMMDTDTPLKLRVTFSAPDFLTARDGKALLRTPFLAQVFGFASRYLPGATTLDKRRFPIRFPFVAGVHERVTVALPESVHGTLALPADKTIDDANLSFSRTFTRDGQNLTGEFDLRLKRLDIPAADYAGLRDDVREIARAGKRAALLSTDSEVKPDKLVMHRKVTVTIADEHTLSTRVEVRSKVLTYAGKKEAAELKLNWNTSSPEPVLEHAVVTDKAGVAHEVSAKEINVLDADWVADAPRYAPSRIKVVSLPAVEEGVTIDYAYTQVTRHLSGISWGAIFASYDAVDADELEIVAPASLRLFVGNHAGARVTQEDGKVRISVTRRELPSPKEPSVAPAKTWAPWIELSSLSDEAAFAAVLREKIAAKAIPDAGIRSKSAELTAGLSTDKEKIVALRDFVAKAIREAGPGWGEIPAGDLSGATRTLADRYGNAADRQLLFTALLCAAGYDATPALFATDELAVATRLPGEPFDSDLYSGFGTRLRLKSGEFIDFTELNQYADWRVNAADGDPVLPLDTGLVGIVRNEPDRTVNTYAIRLADDGDATLAYEDTKSGGAATGFTGWVSEVTPEDRARYFQNLLAGFSRDAKASGPLRTETGLTGKLAFDATIADFAVVQGNYAYFDLPYGAGEIFSGASQPTRRLPYAVGGREDRRSVWTVVLPRGWKLAGDPVSLDWNGPSGIGRVSLAVTEKPETDGTRTVTWTRTVALRAGVVPAEAYPALVELNRRMKSPDTWRVLLEKEPSAAK